MNSVKQKHLSSKRNKLSTFTGGVDSFYTLLTNLDKIDTLLYCINYDVMESQDNLLKAQLNTVKEVAQKFGKKVIVCNTNQRNILQYSNIDYLNDIKKKYNNDIWGYFIHGPCIFSNAYNLLLEYDTIFIPSSHVKSSNYLWGSSFYIDHLYSSSLMKIIHNGDCQRVEKIKTIIELNKDIIFNYLKVCYRNTNQKYNCSICEKCIRTYIPIGIINNDYLKQLKTFDITIQDFEKTKNEYLSMKFNRDTDIEFQNEIKDLNSKNNHFTYQIFDKTRILNGPTYHLVIRNVLENTLNWSKKNLEFVDYSNDDKISKIKNIIPELRLLDSKLEMNKFFIEKKFQNHIECQVIFSLNDINNITLQANTSYFVKPGGYTNTAWESKNNGFYNGIGQFAIKNKIDLESKLKLVNKDILEYGYLIQKNLTDLDLIDNRKHDIRVFILAHSYKGEIQYYLYNNGCSRINVKNFIKEDLTMTNLNTHFNFQKDLPGYSKDKNTMYLVDTWYMKIIINLAHNLNHILPKKSYVNGIMLFGLDIIFDKYLKPYILEFNYNPAFPGIASPSDSYKKFYEPAIKDMIKYIIEPNLLNKSIKETGNWINLKKNTDS